MKFNNWKEFITESQDLREDNVDIYSGKILASLQSVESFLNDISKKLNKLGDIDTSIDFLAAALTGENPLDIAIGQRETGRLYRPPPRRDTDETPT